jgi:hypothetical protein
LTIQNEEVDEKPFAHDAQNRTIGLSRHPLSAAALSLTVDIHTVINIEPTTPSRADHAMAAGSSKQRRWLRGRLGKSQYRVAGGT